MLRLLLPIAQCGYSCMIYGQNKGFEELFCKYQVELLARKYCMWQSSSAPLMGQNHTESGPCRVASTIPQEKYKAAKKG